MTTPDRLIICDFDNTLVDSELVNAELFVRFFRHEAGIESTPEDRDFVDSAAFPDIIRRYKQLYSDALDSLTEEQVTRRFLDFKRAGISSFTVRRATGIEDLLDLDSHLAIVSGSYTEEIVAVAGTAGLPLDRFSPVLGSDQYHPWKPDPTGLIRAARTLGVRPENTIVLEDSISGLTAAIRAAMIPVHLAEFSTVSPEDARAIGAFSFPTVRHVCRSVDALYRDAHGV